MTFGVDPNDVYHNGHWYDRNGNLIDGGDTRYPTITPSLQLSGISVAPFSSGGGSLATAIRFQGRIPIQFGQYPVTELRIPVRGTYVPGSVTNTNIPKIYTVNFAIELSSSFATTSPDVLWGGVATKTVSPGDSLNISDDWCAVNGTIPAGSKGFLRIDLTVPSAGILTSFFEKYSTSADALCYWFVLSASATNSVNGVGVLSGTGSGGNTLAMPIICDGLLAKYGDSLHTSMLVLGDSKTIGTGGLDTWKGKSAISKALTELNVDYVNYGFSGTLLQSWAALSQNNYNIAAYTNWVHIGFPINDITGGRSLAQIQTDLTTLIGKLRAINNAIKIACTKTEPYTDSTDSWATAANQNPHLGDSAKYGLTGILGLYNAWLDTQKTSGLMIDVILNPNTVCEYGGSATSALWVPNGTSDGLHPIDRMINTISCAYKSQLISGGLIPNVTYVAAA